jgi:hypothetical protein
MNSRILWLGLLAADLILFFVLIPVDVYSSNTIFFSFLGGASVFVFLFLALGRFESIYDIIHKPEPGDVEVPGRKLAPFAVIPSLLLVFILIFYHGSRKSNELETYGKLTKGTVIGGQSTSTRRRMQTTTSYNIKVSYQDSLQRQHIFEDDVSSTEFNDLYEGAVVDIVYSSRYPDLAKAVFQVEELAKYKKVPMENLGIDDLLSIFEGGVSKDSALSFLNSINYEWHETETGTFVNDRLQLAVRIAEDQVGYLQQSDLLKYNKKFSFEEDMMRQGFQKKAVEYNGETQEVYYKDNYIVTKERQQQDNSNSRGIVGLQFIDIFRVVKSGGVKD